MKRKFILCLMTTVICFVLVGCSESVKLVNNDSFGEYTGIYKSKGFEVRVVHNDNKLLMLLKKKGNPYGNTNITIDGNTVEDLDCKFEFLDNSLKITTKNKEIPNGIYKKVDGYSTEDIYKDHVGDISFLDNEYNGVFENEKNTVYTVQKDSDYVRFFNKNEESSINIDVDKKEDNHFVVLFFEDNYDLKFGDDSLELKIESETESNKLLSGNYTKKRKMTAEEVIKLFMFDFE